MIKRNKTAIIIFSVLIVGIVAGILVFIFGNSSKTTDYFMYAAIDECDSLISIEDSDADVVRYEDPSEDNDIENLPYERFFGLNYKSDSLEYEIFAYEFETSNDALKYYVNVTGQQSYEKKLPLDDEDENKLLSSSTGMSSYRLVITYQNRAYKIAAPKQYAETINELLANTFSIPIS